MKCPCRMALLLLPLLGALGSFPAAQSNAVAEIDVKLHSMHELLVFSRMGTFPDGLNGLAMETTVCNEGTVIVPWFQPMNPRHPKIAFLMASVRDDRIVQISNRSYVKHGFFAANARGCGPCTNPPGDPGDYLGIGCTDTYATANNGDTFYLGPPDEIDPWLGTWRRQCSLFDRGFPDVASPNNCDNSRSLTRQQASALGMVSRVMVRDEDLALGGTLCFQSQYVVEGLPDVHRDNSLGSRTFTASWTGLRWAVSPNTPLLPGTVLKRWPGATITSGTNGDDDGRVYVATKVTGPVEGFYRYEYALHNVDNGRGVGELDIPICARARVRNAGFRDIDQEAANDWNITRRDGELVFEQRANPLYWNAIYNFWFESDAAPAEGALALHEAKDGPGLPEFAVTAQVPAILHTLASGPGCAFDTPPTLYPVGDPAIGYLGNATFGIGSSGNDPFQQNYLFFSFQDRARPFGRCNLWIAPDSAGLVSMVLSDAAGVAIHPLPIPPRLELEGKAFNMQAVGRLVGRGPLLGRLEVSDALILRLGTAIPDCP